MSILNYGQLIDSGAAEVPMSFFRKFTGVLVVSYCAERGDIQDATFGDGLPTDTLTAIPLSSDSKAEIEFG